MNIWNFLFDNVNNYIYDSSVIDVSNGSVKLLDLGGGTYSTSNPYIETKMSVYHETLLKWSTIEIITGSDSIRYILSKGNEWYYWDSVSSAWSVSDETYSQANISSDIATNFTSFFDSAIEDKTQMRVRIFLHSDTGATTPELKNVEVRYNFGTYTALEHLQPYIQELDLIRLSNDDENKSQFIYQAVVNQCIERAEAIIIEYLQSLYKLPLQATSFKLRLVASYLTIYYLYMRKHSPPEAVMYMKNEAIKQLEDFKNGKVVLDIDPDLIEWQEKKTQVGAFVSTEDLVYTKEKLTVF